MAFHRGAVLLGCLGRDALGLRDRGEGVAFRADQYLWLQLADNTYDNYMMIQQRKKTL